MQRELRSIDQAAVDLGLEPQVIQYCISMEWIIPAMENQTGLDEEDLARLKLIQELREQLGVNDEAVPVILHLLDQIHYLQNETEKNLFRTRGIS